VALANRRYASGQTLTATFQVEPEEARAVKLDMGVAFVGVLADPHFIEYADYLRPTFRIPSSRWIPAMGS